MKKAPMNSNPSIETFGFSYRVCDLVYDRLNVKAFMLTGDNPLYMTNDIRPDKEVVRLANLEVIPRTKIIKASKSSKSWKPK